MSHNDCVHHFPTFHSSLNGRTSKLGRFTKYEASFLYSRNDLVQIHDFFAHPCSNISNSLSQ